MLTYTLATAPAPGAIGIVQLHGPGAAALIQRITGVTATRRVRLVNLAGIDEGLVVALSEQWAQIMPHGGPRVMQRIAELLRGEGASPADDIPPRQLYPEAASECEAQMLAVLAHAASPGAVDLLLDQPRRWAAFLAGGSQRWPDPAASAALDHLVTPPAVVLAGRPNVGKSTLSNLVMGRAASITADLPGTTRDWVAGLAELPVAAAGVGPLVVRWFDTPGVRDTDDPIERRAIELAQQVVHHAAVRIAVTDPATDWPDAAMLGGAAQVRLLNKADLPHERTPGVVEASAITGEGLDALAGAVCRALGLDAAAAEGLWAFSPTLKEIAARRDREQLRRYLGL